MEIKQVHVISSSERREKRGGVGEGETEETMVTRRGWRLKMMQDLREVRAVRMRSRRQITCSRCAVVTARCVGRIFSDRENLRLLSLSPLPPSHSREKREEKQNQRL